MLTSELQGLSHLIFTVALSTIFLYILDPKKKKNWYITKNSNNTNNQDLDLNSGLSKSMLSL